MASGLYCSEELSSDEEEDVCEFVRLYLRRKSGLELEKEPKLGAKQVRKKRSRVLASVEYGRESPYRSTQRSRGSDNSTENASSFSGNRKKVSFNLESTSKSRED
uniref:Uncharacterized protein n=1 Tax=Rhodosorus marinus TaxID=101924 RepID=A0A7S3E7D1_9RHOD|mmetsp:Transcript_15034/g.61294  ORF Transcript_15034/g.61294 Transcript_15034/m.61294 type:complete len:105 (+) Transcript_15034:267-581(+)|eukprot:CAMPEP_0113969878 /NCGR_PEP_ID=MMETSP0011_2-20120614/10661_1 /TAXON_ID=101924 /ORGANISM="Rhodosorus marinus" /LENGTH=104 /DNA_ID=CAMNT_0000983783 /DNA_START=123 /DNA_END=437 /DNA_ORIENTATION=- /assembly_acc=CAM_ASM_000156